MLATKVDADPDTGDFSGERVKRSVEESLERLGLDRVQLMYLHDPEYHLTFAEAMAPGLARSRPSPQLRDQGVLARLGVAGGPVRLMSEFIATGLFDVVLSHNRFTLVDRSAEPLMDDTRQREVAFVNAAPYGGGMLARGPDASRSTPTGRPARYRNAVRAMQRACAARGVPLAAAALQFSVRDPRVASTVVGVSEPSRIEETATLMSQQIPAELWAELDSLTVAPEYWLS